MQQVRSLIAEIQNKESKEINEIVKESNIVNKLNKKLNKKMIELNEHLKKFDESQKKLNMKQFIRMEELGDDITNIREILSILDEEIND